LTGSFGLLTGLTGAELCFFNKPQELVRTLKMNKRTNVFFIN